MSERINELKRQIQFKRDMIELVNDLLACSELEVPELYLYTKKHLLTTEIKAMFLELDIVKLQVAFETGTIIQASLN